MHLKVFAPNVASFGYGLFLAINATSVWGGSFPLLPLDIQGFELLATFSFAQSSAFCCSFLICVLGAYGIPHFTERIPIMGCTALFFLGSISLIAPLYVPNLMLLLIIAGGVLLGVGSAGLLALWQQVFASQKADRGGLNIIMGTAISALVYVALHAIPFAVAAFMIAFVFVPLSCLCLILATRSVNWLQPMFKDDPRHNRQVYQLALGNLWRSALCVGGLTFLDGVTRALALDDPSHGTVVNLLAMGGALIACFALVILWRRYSFRFDTILSFRTIFPLVSTSLLALPLLGMSYLQVLSGILHMFSTFAIMIMMIQCAQTSRNNGINPIFIYGFFGLIVFSLQSSGFLSGYISSLFIAPGFPQLAIVALFSTWLLALVLYCVRGRIQGGASELQERWNMESIEFIALGPPPPVDVDARAKKPDPAWAQLIHLRDPHDETSAPVSDEHYRDRLAKQCVAVAHTYRLSAREAEIAEFLARGNSVAHIAKTLVISENTVRFHSKNLYMKLNIHKRQDLVELLEEM
ncbi:MAG: helix-turn-helix transcriptional regulator [Coriobacteriales bacterium]|jgi:DNA-binding CsgD family transcriptional regulator|nr:helix-turn-helix transcriptional regulator [Coriobacteriales bacterium]